MEDGVTGYLLQPEDAEAFADRILRLSREPALARRMGEAGYRKAKAYTVAAVKAELSGTLMNSPEMEHE